MGEGSFEGRITFRMFNEEYQWILEEFNMCYELLVEGESDD